MKLPTRPTAAAFLLAAAGTLHAHGVSPRTEPLEAAAESTKAAVVADAKLTKLATRILGLLGKRSNERTLADEIRSVAAAAKIAESKFPGDAALLAAFGEAADGYDADLRIARDSLAAAAASDQVPAKLRKRYQKAFARVDGALVPGKAPTPIRDRLARYAGAAAAAKGFTPYDAGAAHAWVLAGFELAPAGTGVDLTGDGKPDNAFASIQALAVQFGIPVDVEALFAGGAAQDGRYGLLEMWYVQDLAKGDPFVFAGLLGGTDADGDPGNDLLGTGTFLPVPGTVGDDGHATVRVASSVAKGGKYGIEFSGQALQLGGLALPASARLVVEGTASPDANSGLVGIAVPATVVAQAIADAGIELNPLVLGFLNNLADVDLDGNGSKDAFSGAFTFEAVKATIAADR